MDDYVDTVMTSSLDWARIDSYFRKHFSNAPWSPDTRKMLRNIQSSVTELSKAELASRRTAGHPTRRVDELLVQINEQIALLDQYLLLQLLSS